LFVKAREQSELGLILAVRLRLLEHPRLEVALECSRRLCFRIKRVLPQPIPGINRRIGNNQQLDTYKR